MTRTLMGVCVGTYYGASAGGPAVAWWWVVLTCTEVGWVLGVWLLLRDTNR
jgi:hypothetical protein